MRGITVTLLLAALGFTIFFKLTGQESIFSIGETLLRTNPLAFAAVGAVVVIVYVSAMMWSRRRASERVRLGKAVASSLTLRLVVVLTFVGILILGLMLWLLGSVWKPSP